MFSKLILFSACALASDLLKPAPSPIDACPPLSKMPAPTNVRNMRPVDVQVMGAMGDSITAGFAITGLPVESRGLSYAIGDNAGAHTLFNFVKHYNPNVIGGSHFDVAVTGGLVQGMLKQAKKLVADFKKDRRIDMANDFKIVTIWIGANNMCPSCKGNAKNQPPAYETELRQALDFMETNLNKTLVNLMATLPLSTLVTTEGVEKHCKLQHAALTRLECPCAFNEPVALDSIVLEDAAITEKLAKEYSSKNNAGFTVVYQPGLRKSHIPSTDYLSTLDCFHPSKLGHELVAQIIWQNMFERVGAKTESFEAFPWDIFCPSDTSIIQA